ncbi:hypothetical protein ACFPYJ_29475 [Paenibacillus solisilvae]|uniref:Spore coat protein n=1 Tax=Paenibacillus solisilvae TaxID=2486751 RepID=A0ABW0W903_9BACL
MWKMTGWLAKSVAAGLIISFLSIWTTGYIVNSYVETLLKQFNIPLEEKPFALNGVWGSIWGADPALKTDGAAADGKKASSGDGESAAGKDDTADEGTPPVAVDAFGDLPSGALSDIGGGSGPKGNSGSEDSAAGADSSAGSSGAAGNDSGNGSSNSGSTSEADSSSGSSGSGADEALKDGVAMTTDQLNEAKSKLSAADKDELFNVMMKKLPQNAWQQISGWMEGGLTAEEMTQVQQLIAQYLDRSEYDSMMKILNKY